MKQLDVCAGRKHLSVHSSTMFPNISILQSLESSTRHLRKYGASYNFYLFILLSFFVVVNVVVIFQITTVIIIWTLNIIKRLLFAPGVAKDSFVLFFTKTTLSQFRFKNDFSYLFIDIADDESEGKSYHWSGYRSHSV